MKKLFCVLLVALMLMGTVFAEETFTMRCGIQFGDSKEAVLEKDDLFQNGSYGEWGTNLSIKDVPVSDFGKWLVIHSFKDDGSGLYKTEYRKDPSYYWTPSRDSSYSSTYHNLVEQLTTKYGVPEISQLDDKEYNTWRIWLDDGALVIISCVYEDYHTEFYLDPNSLMKPGPALKDHIGETHYGFEILTWTYEYFAPEEAINPDI